MKIYPLHVMNINNPNILIKDYKRRKAVNVNNNANANEIKTGKEPCVVKTNDLLFYKKRKFRHIAK